MTREEAIQVLQTALTAPFIYGEYANALAMAIEALSDDRPSGEWVLDPNGLDWNLPAWRCSECGFVASYIGVEANGLGNNPTNWAGSKFCPNCGAIMKGDSE